MKQKEQKRVNVSLPEVMRSHINQIKKFPQVESLEVLRTFEEKGLKRKEYRILGSMEMDAKAVQDEIGRIYQSLYHETMVEKQKSINEFTSFLKEDAERPKIKEVLRGDTIEFVTDTPESDVIDNEPRGAGVIPNDPQSE